MASDPDTLTTLVLTVGERVKLARCVVMAVALADEISKDTPDLLLIWERLAPGDEA